MTGDLCWYCFDHTQLPRWSVFCWRCELKVGIAVRIACPIIILALAALDSMARYARRLREETK